MPKPDLPIKDARILIVDDNPTNVALLGTMLEGAGYRHIKGLTDSRQVIPLLTESEFDLVLLDIRMPHIDGLAILSLLGQLDRDDFLPVLVLTAQTDQETRQAALAAGAKDFISKPFLQWEVMQRIHNMLETRMFYRAQRRRGDALEDEVRARTREIRDTQVEIIRRLGQAAEFRDNETGAHILRMSHYCQVLALAHGQSAAEAESMLVASPMHDIGKIGIPDAILLKPGKLTPEEFEIMKGHTIIGHNLLDNHPSEFMRLAREIALTHQEKYDGSGYPHGLAGEAIPLSGRISALADVFDALTSKRPYKEAWPVERAVALVRDQAGKHFDPVLTDLFLGQMDAILRIKERFQDN
ncbi:MAG: response regulator [Rhodospirillales bacterium]|nr:response regulator [Rhodospirillales bacterium]